MDSVGWNFSELETNFSKICSLRQAHVFCVASSAQISVSSALVKIFQFMQFFSLN